MLFITTRPCPLTSARIFSCSGCPYSCALSLQSSRSRARDLGHLALWRPRNPSPHAWADACSGVVRRRCLRHQHGLDSASFVHRGVRLGDLGQGQGSPPCLPLVASPMGGLLVPPSSGKTPPESSCKSAMRTY